MSIETKQLHALSAINLEAVYGGAKKEAPKDTRLTVTAADKKANTKAYQNYKAGNKAYKAADHLKNESVSNWREDLKEVPNYDQIPASSKKRNEKISEKNVKNTVKINPEMKEELKIIEEYVDELSESDIADILARLEKKRISKGGNPDESPLGKKVGRAMKSQQDKARKKAGVE